MQQPLLSMKMKNSGDTHYYYNNNNNRPLKRREDAVVAATLRFGLLLCSLCILSFFMGQLYGYHIEFTNLNQRCLEEKIIRKEDETLLSLSEEGEEQQWMMKDDPNKKQRIKQQTDESVGVVKDEKTTKLDEQQTTTNHPHNNNKKIWDQLLNDTKTSKFASGFTRVRKTDFIKKINVGFPISPEESDVLIIHNYPTSMPKKNQYYTENIASSKNVVSSSLSKFSVENALENCEGVNIMMTDNPENLRQCLAIVGQYESYHVPRWLRMEDTKGGDGDHPMWNWTPVSRGTKSSSGSLLFPIPGQKELEKSWEFLRLYFENLDIVLKELYPITERIQKKDTIIVTTCNFGQSELLMNFVCSARSRGLDTTNVLVFATDIGTHELAESLGLTSYFLGKHYPKTTFPRKAANRYADDFFTSMMISKVISVQLISLLGYHIIFQDVDIIWWRNPMEYFSNTFEKDTSFDMYFQEDGNRIRYTPLSANSGFYMVRYNQRTKYLLTSLLYSLDKILETGSHQEALVTHLNEHISLYNLRVKVISREDFNFPGGFHYHRRGHMIKQFFENKLDSIPYLFHMSWTKNKDFKIKFFQQMGEWFVHDKCIATPKKDILDFTTTTTTNDTTSFDLEKTCCLVEPNITCWYRDKPSKKPCKTSEGLDGGPSFW